MKKLLGIIVLILVWANPSFANPIPDLANSKWEVRKSVPIKKQFFEFYDSGRCRYSFKDLGFFKYEYDDCEWKQNGSKFQITTYSNNNSRSDYEGTIYPNSLSGKYINKYYGSINFTGTPVFIRKTISTGSTSSSSGSGDKIAQSKKICKELGFKTNSEKFADCALKMMSLQFEAGSKVSNSDGSSTQKIIVQQQDDFDLGDFFFGLQKIVDDNYRSTKNSSSTSSTGQNCRIYERQWGAEVKCK